ncbi:MAG: NAD(P)/FAD-dependent oxidoreductase, partial [Alphaproteobacteria bacterium]
AHDRTITVDRGLRTTNRRIYAIGDVAGGPMFTHVAGYHAGVVIRSMLFALPSRVRLDHLPWASYTDPELAQVGLTETQARERHGDRVEVVRMAYSDSDRAVAEGRTEGLVKVIVHRGRPVGVSIAGAQAGELVGLWALAIAARLKMSHVAGMVAPYPTLMELGKRAAGAYFSPRLFDSSGVRRAVRLVQRLIP